jgi:TM2 domain-containing membrane protein YozV
MPLFEIATKSKNRQVAALLAIAGAVAPISGFHKFYMGQPIWGGVYLLLSFTPIPRVASAIEAVWYLFQDGDEFDRRFNAFSPPPKPRLAIEPKAVEAIADALRQLDQLRADGLISEYEFEQKRRSLLNQIP